jgi:hypothetical protein
MKLLSILLLAAILALAGCDNTKSTPRAEPNPAASGEDAKIKASLDKLSPEDRGLAQAQKRCPVTDQLLGSMGVPIKLMVNGQPVFVCCQACPKEALKDPDKTLQKVTELKKETAQKDQ